MPQAATIHWPASGGRRLLPGLQDRWLEGGDCSHTSGLICGSWPPAAMPKSSLAPIASATANGSLS